MAWTLGTNVTASLDVNNILIVTGTGAMTDYSMAGSPLYGNTLIQGIVIESGITTIGNSIFNGCSNSTYVTIADTVTSIGSDAFRDCASMATVGIPGSVTSIGAGAFYGNTSLTKITIPGSATTLGNYIFSACTGLTKVTLEKGLTAIPDATFYGTHNLATIINLSETNQTIGANAFFEAGRDAATKAAYAYTINTNFITAVQAVGYTIGSVHSLGTSAYGLLNETTGDLTVAGTGLTNSYGIDSPFYGNTSITSIVVEEGISYLGSSIFRNLPNLVEIAPFPDSCITVGVGLFRDCIGLTLLPTGLFDNCTGTSNFSYFFSGCSNLSSIPSDLFANCTSATSFNYCFEYCSSLTSIPGNLFSNLTNISDMGYTFRSCTGITSIPVGLFDTNVGIINFIHCFDGCSSLVSIPTGLFKNNAATNLGYCFQNCISLTSIPAGLFQNCSSVTSLAFCFYGCNLLGAIPVGLFDDCTQVTDFSQCFNGCSSLNSIPNNLFHTCTLATGFSTCFSGCSSLISIPANLFEKNTLANSFFSCFYGCESLISVPMGLFDNCPSVTTFMWCFINCHSLEKAYISSLMVELGSNLFGSCGKLGIIIDLSDSLKEVHSGLFSGGSGYNVQQRYLYAYPSNSNLIASANTAGYTTRELPSSFNYLFSGGTGTELDPYEVGNYEQLNLVGEQLSSHFIQTADIDCMEWGYQHNFKPIGDSTASFVASYDGQNHTIENLYCHTSETAGLFREVEGNIRLKNIHLRNVDVASTSTNPWDVAGGLVGSFWQGTSGSAEDPHIFNCSVTGSVHHDYAMAGLLAGQIYAWHTDYKIFVRNCWAEGTKTGNISCHYSGIFAGFLYYADVASCYAKGTVAGYGSTGGFTGETSDHSKLRDCYFIGDVTATENYAGVFAGYSTSTCDVQNCYTVGTVTAVGSNIGAFTGYASSGFGVQKCYFDSTVSNTINAAGGGTEYDIQGKTTAEMKNIDTFSGFSISKFDAVVEAALVNESSTWNDTLVGAGTEINPYLIDNYMHMAKINDNLSAHYRQTKDIVLPTTWYIVDGQYPDLYQTSHSYRNMIGSDTNRFTGTYDGGNYQITNFCWTDEVTGYAPAGFFGVVDGATLKNINISGYVKREANVGLLVGEVYTAIIDNCHVAGTAKGDSNVGGLVGFLCGGAVTNSSANCYIYGFNPDGYGSQGVFIGASYGSPTYSILIEECESNGTIENGRYFVGGFTGETTYTNISKCRASGNLESNYTPGNALCGGFVGYIGSNSSIEDCYCDVNVVALGDKIGGFFGESSGINTTVSDCMATGSVSGGASVGGFAGISSLPVSNCYSTGNVTITASYGGGFAGQSHTSVTNCYSTGSITGAGIKAGFAARLFGSAVNCYWDTETSLETVGYVDGPLEPTFTLYGKTTIEMTSPYAEGVYSTWDFENTWGETSGNYPALRWEGVLLETLSMGTAVNISIYSDKRFEITGTGPMDNFIPYKGIPLKDSTGIKKGTIAEGVTSIGDYTFQGSRLEEITIPSTVTSIGKDAFKECQYLTSVTNLSETDQVIGMGAFNKVGQSVYPRVFYAQAGNTSFIGALKAMRYKQMN